MEWFENKIIPIKYEPYLQYFNKVPDHILEYYDQFVFTEKHISKPLLNFMISEWLTYAFRNYEPTAVYIYMFGWEKYEYLMFNDQVTDSIYMFYAYFNKDNPNYIFGYNYPPSFLVNLDAEI